MSGLAVGQAKPCEACGTQIVGCLTRAGKVAPIEVTPSPQGNVLTFRASLGEYGRGQSVAQCRTFGEGMALFELREQGVPLRLNHFASCPEAHRFVPGRA